MTSALRLEICTWMRSAAHLRCGSDTLHRNIFLWKHLGCCNITSHVITRCVTLTPCRCYHSSQLFGEQQKTDDRKGKEIVESKDKPFSELTLGEKVTRAGKDATYTGIVIAGIAVTGIMFYAIGRELFSGQSPSGVYGRAFKLCRKNEQVIDALGEPIKGYGEMTSRGRRRFVKHVEYEVNGVKHMQMQFYLEGPLNKATAHVEVQQNERRKYQFRYLYVELNSYPRRTIFVEDNR